jgi:lathosterol oxidase
MPTSFLTGETYLWLWLASFAMVGVLVGVVSGFFQFRNIQPGTFKWRTLRREGLTGALNLTISTLVLSLLIAKLESSGWITFQRESASWWVIGLEYVLSFFLFDAYFYWVHRLMHSEPYYRWVHKLHHRSTSPVPITSWSMHPLEGIIEGAFVPLFLAVFTVHQATMPLIAPTNVLMGLYVHSGFEFMPRWWNRSWWTKWFITATFHDQHHHYFTGNYGGYTTIWDRLCGTMRSKFEDDFEKLTGPPHRSYP